MSTSKSASLNEESHITKMMNLPPRLNIKKQIAPRVYLVCTKLEEDENNEFILKWYSRSELDSFAAALRIPDEDDEEYFNTEDNETDTILESRVIYTINIHYTVQSDNNIRMTSEYYCQNNKKWITSIIIDGDEYHKENFSCNISIIPLICIIGVKFNKENKVFESLDTCIGLLFPKLEGPLMLFDNHTYKWIPNNIFARFFTESYIANIFKQTVYIAYTLYEKYRLVHKDIKLENLCFLPFDKSKDDHLRLMFIDLGEAQILSTSLTLKDAYGTHCNLPPECFMCFLNNSKLGYNAEKREIWSLGCLLHTIVFGYSPLYNIWKNKSPLQYQLALCNLDEHIEIPLYSENLKCDISTKLKDLLCSMLCKHPESRSSFVNVLHSNWLA
ncbi:uncharacterized protein CMU_009460 [Cryptosporidium muris RN66]|uniref:Serine/threonine-protein kinase 1 n=1 Tax=Cryptosporidium muris (strain RN66) TaxID=441375 RepID=B6AE13_CRYMR|nr:uncharacterized protein CMU_009460 [Cryptosporidium muris RN66]EEA06454.1 hypothetical protein, conserved [Cryptosporidium muris RN66]|eukprot:XP_002140803.1 hypothetical protein [Cryptosporidium muris RN66]